MVPLTIALTMTMAPTCRDGRDVFTFGDAFFHGSLGNVRLNKSVVGLTADPSTSGYRMVESDGGIFSFGAPFYGSLGSSPPATPVTTMASSVDGRGYHMIDAGGQVFAFGDAKFLGNAVS
jgi:hypothetical protein